MARVANTLTPLKNSIVLLAFILVVWGFYRNLVQLPEVVDELVSKPVIWLGATYYLMRKEGASWDSLGITNKNLYKAIYFALILAIVFALEGFAVNYFKHEGFNFGVEIGVADFYMAIGLSFITAVTEELTFRGYIFSRVWRYTKNAWLTNLVVSVGWVLVHVPIAVFVWTLAPTGIASYGLLVFIFSLGAGLVYQKSGNILSPILLHVFWQWPIILFR